MAMYDVCEPRWCPECPPVTNKKGKRIDAPLECCTSNYSGTGEDAVVCNECGKVWFVSYKIDKLTRAESWDIGPREEREAQEREEQELEKRKEIAKAVEFLQSNNYNVLPSTQTKQ